MLAKIEITINGEKWIADFETRTVYKKVIVIPNRRGFFPMSGRFGDYPIKEFTGNLYFETEDNFYEIVGNEAIEISEEEYKKVKSYITLKKKDPYTLNTICANIIPILIADIMDKKFNLKISVPLKNSTMVKIFSQNFTPEIKGGIKRIAKRVNSMLPIYVKRETISQQIRDIYKNAFKEDDALINALIDKIYLNDKRRFDHLSEEIIKSSNSRKKITEDITKDSQLIKEEIVEQKRKLK